MTTLEAVLAIITALGLGSVLPDTAKAVIGHFQGRKSRELAAMTRLSEQIEGLEDELETSEATVRILREYGHELRVLLIQRGVPSDDIPPFPRTIRP